jgi:hypothetical protein
MTKRMAWILIAAALAAPGLLEAQSYALDRGSLAVAGQASFTSSRSDGVDGRRTSYGLSPSVLYFVRPGLALGASASVGHTSFDGSSATAWTLGPTATLYFGREAAEFHPFVTATVGLGHSSFDTPVDEESVSHTRVRVGVGVLKLLTEGVGVHGQAGYERLSYGGDGDGWDDNIGLAFGFSIFVF